MAKHLPAWATFFAVATVSIVPTFAANCPPATEPYDNSADNPPEKQGVEHSAVLLDAGGTDKSAAPTVKKVGKDVVANTDCPKEPSRLPNK
jgi:hypothetical protein